MSAPRAHCREVIVSKLASDSAVVAIAGASVLVCNRGTTVPISQTIYSAATGSSTLSNPLASNALGVVEFWVPIEQTVDLVVSIPGFSNQTVTCECLVATESGAVNLNTTQALANYGDALISTEDFKFQGLNSQHTLVDLDRAQTITGVKTFSSGISGDGAHTLTLPAATDTLVGRATQLTGDLGGTIQSPTVAVGAKANLLINGGFEIWQRGAGPFTASGAYSADRWSCFISGTDALSIAKDTTHVDSGSGACLAATVTHGTGIGTTISQKLEDTVQLNGLTLSFSLRASCGVVGSARIGISVDGGSTWTWGAANTGSSHTFETLTVTATLAGATAAFVGVEFLASDTVYLDNAMLVVGPSPVNYIPLTPAEEMARCQRYYEVLVASAFVQTPMLGQATGSGGGYALWRFRTPKAVTPSVTVTNAASFSAFTAAGGSQALSSASATEQFTDHALIVCNVASGLAAGNVFLLTMNATNAQIVAEANP